MALSTVILKLNWRLLFVHFVACWLFIYAFQSLVVLHDFKFVISLKTSVAKPQHIDVYRLSDDVFWMQTFKMLGLLVGFAISLFMSLKKGWYWVNAVIVFIVTYILWRFNLSGWQFLRHMFLLPGRPFNADTIWPYLIDGLFMLLIGFILFFSKRLMRFIDATTENESLVGAA